MHRKYFFLFFAIVLWLLMAVGFSDNWLFDRGQESNYMPKFMIHAFFAFCWFSLLVIQSALIRMRNHALHFRIGIIGMIVYYVMTLTIWNLYIEVYRATSDPMKLFKPLEIFSLLLVSLAFLIRKREPQRHKEYIVFGTFCLIGPALDRTVFHLFGPEYMMWPMIALYWVLFLSFVWYKKGLTWYMLTWMVLWTYSLFPLLRDLLFL